MHTYEHVVRIMKIYICLYATSGIAIDKPSVSQVHQRLNAPADLWLAMLCPSTIVDMLLLLCFRFLLLLLIFFFLDFECLCWCAGVLVC